MKIIYSIGFDISKNGGKSRATRQKIKAINKAYSNVKVIKPRSNIPLLLSLIKNELLILYYILFNKADVIVYRGYVGFIHYLFRKFTKVKMYREVHSYSLEEVSLLKKSKLSKFLITLVSKIMLRIELTSDRLIFNHPDLESFFKEKLFFSGQSFAVYNGYELDEKTINKNELMRTYNIPKDKFIICFTGSVSLWHGIDYVLSLAEKFLESDNVVFIIAGGAIDVEMRNVINITPCKPQVCDALVSISDCCLLPVKNNRVSPGSPLKLYDYIKFRKPIITQENMKGYSDECLKYQNTLIVNFENISDTYEKVLNFISESDDKHIVNDKFVESCKWENRLKEWKLDE